MAQKGPSIYNRRQNVKENRFCAVGKREHLPLRKGGKKNFQQRHKSLALKPWMQSEQKKQFVHSAFMQKKRKKNSQCYVFSFWVCLYVHLPGRHWLSLCSRPVFKDEDITFTTPHSGPLPSLAPRLPVLQQFYVPGVQG